MTQPHSISIHEFEASGTPVYYDDEGDQMIGFYYQLTDQHDQPLTGLIGPYRYKQAVEQAARKAFNSN